MLIHSDVGIFYYNSWTTLANRNLFMKYNKGNRKRYCVVEFYSKIL